MKFLLFVTLMASLNVMAGNEKGNGGTVLDCGDSVRLADFAEVTLRPGLKGKITILESDASTEKQVEDALVRLSNINATVGKAAREELQIFEDEVFPIENEYEWTVTTDVGPFPVPQNCRLRNTVMYFDGGSIEMSMPLFRKLTPTHQAGLKIHEVIYRLVRRNGIEGSSLPARRITAMLFAEKPDQEILKSLVTAYLGNLEKHTSFLFEATDQVINEKSAVLLKDCSHLCYSFVSLRNQYEFTNINAERWKLVGLVAGDFFQLKIRLVTMGSTSSKFEFGLVQNNDPKPRRARAAYQVYSEMKPFELFANGGYGEMKVYIGFTSPKMKTYMKGRID